MRLGIDIMGGDTPPEKLFEAVIRASQVLDATFEVYASESMILSLKAKDLEPSIHLTPSSETITMDDDPLEAIRKKQGASLSLGLQDLHQGKIDAFISVGNTGALVAGAVLLLDKIEGVQRPGLLALLPTRKGCVAVIDVGANLSCKPQHLLQYGQLGTAFMQMRYQSDRPAVGLLNIGVESQKGRQELKEAYQLLQNSSLNFVGNIEGTVAFHGDVDVIVTDGFSGNVFLKASEGMASFIYEESGLEPRFDYEEYPGALLCGLDKVVIKCHGNSSPKGLFSGIIGASSYIENGLIKGLRSSL